MSGSDHGRGPLVAGSVSGVEVIITGCVGGGRRLLQ